ncbi:MAG TPA: urease accessory protein UreD [Acetobacteraceae bacterium]
MKARFPRPDPGAWAHVVTLNSAGGVAGGDTLAVRIGAGTGTSATVASQAAERIYRALPGATARIATTLQVEAGAALEWLPQETILFDGCALQRTLDIELAEDAAFLGVETLVFGRAAMEEEVRTARVHDRVRLRRGGRLVLQDAVRLDGPVAPLLRRRAVADGARAVATIWQVGPGGAGLEALRAAFGEIGAEAGVSVVDGVLVARIVAPTGASMRKSVVTGLNILSGGRTLPRVWFC